jgi:AcrR family transcriptional regulator
MTKDEIIKTAFRVWGRELYLTTSLTKIAAELGVSKPALYRHFKSKQTLLNAMDEAFFADYAAFIRPSYEAALRTESIRERFLIMMRTVVDYYARNEDAFIFSLIRLYDSRRGENMGDQLRRQGIDIRKLQLNEENIDPYPSLFQLISITLIFWVAVFHKPCPGGKFLPGELPAAGDIGNLIGFLEKRILTGLGVSEDAVEALDFEALEKGLPRDFLEALEDRGLLKAVAAAVAEAGPWKTSMGTIARRSGLSKSGLYAHFKNKQDMIRQLFQTEFEHLADYAEAGSRFSALPAERFYLVILSMADYLRSRTEVLITADWIKTQRVHLGLEIPPRLYKAFFDAGLSFPGQDQDPALAEYTVQWILFLIVNLLMRLPDGMDFAELPNSSIRRVFRFIGLGAGGFNL